MKFLKKFEMMTPPQISGRTFKDTLVGDLCWMTVGQVITMIMATFPGSKIIESSREWTIVESPWEIIEVPDLKMLTDNYDDVIKKNKFRIYFHISVNSYKIIRGSYENISKFLDYLGEKGVENYHIRPGLDTSSTSFIFRGNEMPYICWSYGAIQRGEECVESPNGNDFLLNNMGCNEIRLDNKDNKTIAYFSTLLIGSDIEIREGQYLDEIIY